MNLAENIIGKKHESYSFIIKSIAEVLQIQPEQDNILYSSPQTCLTVYQNLCSVSQTILKESIIQQAFVQWSASTEYLETIINDDGQNRFHELLILRIFVIQTSTKDNKVQKKLVFNQHFRQNIQQILTGNITKPCNLVRLMKSDEQKKLIDYEIASKTGWKSLIDILQGLQHQGGQIDINRLGQNLKQALLKVGGYFEFILSTTKQQLHNFLNAYVSALAQKYSGKYQVGEIINIIIQFSTLHPQNIYSVLKEKEMNLQTEILQDFLKISLIHFEDSPNRNENYFAISKLLHNFMVGPPEIRIDTKCEIIVETNFMVYVEVEAENNNEGPLSRNKDIEFLKGLIELFCTVKVIFPHMIIAEINEESVKNAYRKNGLTSALIIDFFNKCCSSKRRKYVNDKKAQQKNFDAQRTEVVEKAPLHFLKLFQKNYEIQLVPENVAQQLELWEKEKNCDNSETNKKYIQDSQEQYIQTEYKETPEEDD